MESLEVSDSVTAPEGRASSLAELVLTWPAIYVRSRLLFPCNSLQLEVFWVIIREGRRNEAESKSHHCQTFHRRQDFGFRPCEGAHQRAYPLRLESNLDFRGGQLIPAALTRPRDLNVLPIFGCILVESVQCLAVGTLHVLDHRRWALWWGYPWAGGVLPYSDTFPTIGLYRLF